MRKNVCSHFFLLEVPFEQTGVRGCHDTQDNDILHNDTQNHGRHDTQHNDIQNNDAQHKDLQRSNKNARISLMTISKMTFNAYAPVLLC